MTYYTEEELMLKYNDLPDALKIDCLYKAIGHMQQESTREVFYCVCLAMGYSNETGETDAYYKVEDLKTNERNKDRKKTHS